MSSGTGQVGEQRAIGSSGDCGAPKLMRYQNHGSHLTPIHAAMWEDGCSVARIYDFFQERLEIWLLMRKFFKVLCQSN